MSEETTIRRGVRNARYTTVPNHVFEDMHLSMEARWLLGYLLSKPDDWVVRLSDIRKKGGCGRDKARSMVSELVRAGYAEKEAARKDGKFNGLCLVIYDEPKAAEAIGDSSVAFVPQPEKPSTAEPSTVLPAPVNPPLVKTDDLAIPENSSRESAGAMPEDRKKIERLFDRAWRDWPVGAAGSRPEAFRVWMTLSPEERQTARDSVLRWLSAYKAAGRGLYPAMSRYLAEKRWEELPEEEPEPSTSTVEGRPWGPHWAGVCHRELLTVFPQPAPQPSSAFLRDLLARDDDAGRAERLRRQAAYGWPKVKLWHDAAADRKSISVTSDDTWLAEWMEFVPADSPAFADWQSEYERRGWPWIPDPGSMPGVFFPKGGPAGLEAFEAAIRNEANDHDGGGREAAE